MSDLVERLRKEIKFSLPRNTVHIDLLGEAADRIAALEEDIRSCQESWHRMTNNKLVADKRIEALEAALRFILTDPPAALDEPDTDAEIIRHYREVARAALAPEQDKP